MERAKKVWGKVNVMSYTSAFEPIVQMPSEYEIKRMKSIMKELKPSVEDMNNLYKELETFLPVRENTLQLISEAIESFNVRHRKVNIAKATGSSASLVGTGLLVGGAIAAPFTLGVSLIATAVGAGICTAGGLTSAGASITELCISKKKVAEIQKAIEVDNECSKKIQDMWESIVGTCTEVAEKHSDTGYSIEDILSVLLVCCINQVPDRVLKWAPKGLTEKAKDSKLQGQAEHCEASVAHAMEVGMGVQNGGRSIVNAGRVAGGAVVTAFVVRYAASGSRAVCHCAKMVGVTRKVVIAAKVFRVATGINPVLTIALSFAGGVMDLVSLVYAAYQIHNKSDSSAGKELIKVRDELKESQEQLEQLKTCLSEVINSMES